MTEISHTHSRKEGQAGSKFEDCTFQTGQRHRLGHYSIGLRHSRLCQLETVHGSVLIDN